MNCYNCGCNLTEHDFCTNCKADVSNYKLVVSASNILYNEGLDKARVRDLSGAAACLRQCLKLNKNHVDARNLLGLVYFEQGECVLAMNEWVMSMNLQSGKNLAEDYIERMQSNPGKLDNLNAAIKKYNLSLEYCYQDSLDLAVIQLKKVLSMNPRYLQAHQLLALLYMKNEEWQRARKELERCLRIDSGNTRALRYLQEIDVVLGETERGPRRIVKGEPKQLLPKPNTVSDDSYQYQSGNETIIQPMNYSEKKSFQALWNLVIGIVAGLAIAWFLILPARIQNEKAVVNEELRQVSEQLDVKSATINELESKVKKLENEIAGLNAQLEDFVGSGGTLEDVNYLLQAVSVYMETPGDTDKIGEYIEKINPESVDKAGADAFAALYKLLLSVVGPQIANTYYQEGMTAYQNENFEEAIEALSRATVYDASNGDAYFNLANAYRKLEKNAEAGQIYQKIIELFPGTSMANRSQSYLNELGEE